MTNPDDRGRDPRITSRMMAKVKSKDTKAELAVRHLLHARGLRYRVHYSKVYGHPDIVFTRRRVAVFIDGDFWHGNAWRVRGLPSLAAQFPNRTEWWVAKLERNIERDLAVTQKLTSEGWTVLRFWESEIVADADKVVDSIVDIIQEQI